MTLHRTAAATLAGVLLGAAGCAAGAGDAIDGSAEVGAEATVFDTFQRYDSGPSIDTGSLDTGSGMDTSPRDGGIDVTQKDASTPDTRPPAEAETDGALPEGTTSETGPTDGGAPETGAETGPSEGGHEGGAEAGVPESGTESGVPCATSGFSGALATFDLVGEPGDEASAAVTSTGGGVSSGALSRAVTLTPVSGVDSINGSDWGMGTSADATRYYTFTVTPGPGCTVTLTSLALDVRASSTGPKTGDVATSAYSFKKHTTSFAGTSVDTVTLSASDSAAIEIRVYGYAATGSGGTFRIRNTMTLSGTVL